MANGQNVVIQTFPPAMNGQQLQFANINLAMEGVYFNFFTELEYSWTVDVEEGRGASPFPMGTTAGMYKASGSITVQLAYREAFEAIVAQFSPDRNSISDAILSFQAQWQARAGINQIQAPVFTDELIGCRIISSGISGSSGPGVMVVKYGLYIALVRDNGRAALAGLPR